MLRIFPPRFVALILPLVLAACATQQSTEWNTGKVFAQRAESVRALLPDPAIEIEGQGSDMRILIPADQMFAAGSGAIRPDATTSPAALARALNGLPGDAIVIRVHSDNTGDAGANRRLTTAQARALSDALVAAGLPAARITEASGIGEAQPRSSNLTAEGRARNRRIEIIVRGAIPIRPVA